MAVLGASSFIGVGRSTGSRLHPQRIGAAGVLDRILMAEHVGEDREPLLERVLDAVLAGMGAGR